MNNAKTSLVCAALLGLALLLPRSAAAAWPSDPSVNVPLCTASGAQECPVVVPDAAGGAVVVWRDSRNGGYGIYARRLAPDGTPLWAANGVALCTSTGLAVHPTLISDGASGAIVAWTDARGGSAAFDVYAQRVSGAGVVQWTPEGLPVCTAGSYQEYPTLVGDDAGGAIIAWEDWRNGSWDVYAQRISAGGAAQWTANGVAVSTAAGGQHFPFLTPDGVGGAIVVWFDQRNGGEGIYAQRISAAGVPQWTANGVALCADAGMWDALALTTDGAGGAIVVWDDLRNGNRDLYAQRVSASGVPQWTTNGVAICTAAGDQVCPTVTTDGAGGAIAAWQDQRGGMAIYAQRVLAVGAAQWTVNGVALSTTASGQYTPAIAADRAGGAIVVWCDQLLGGATDICAQHISSGGVLQWNATGLGLCTAAGTQWQPAIATDGVGGAIATWGDDRSGIDYDIYAQRVQGSGQLGGTVDVPADVTLAFALDPVRPNPSHGGTLTVHCSLPTDAPARLELLDVAGRRIASREVGAGQRTLDLGAGQRLAPGLYLVRLTQGANTRVTRAAVLR